MPDLRAAHADGVPLRYELLRWAPGREVRVHKPRLPAILGKPLVKGVGIALALFVVLLVLTWGTDLGHLVGLSSVILVPAAMLALMYAGIDFAVSRGSGPRTVTIDWSALRVTEETPGRTTLHDLDAVQAPELRRVETTGESSPSSYSCEVLLQLRDEGGVERSVEILATATADELDRAVASIHPLATQLAHALGKELALTNKEY